ncbi:acid-sensing ion channel 1C-like [Montipora foliosa]|uniref:acid-sensing ion channel 1C-like n=1 Tax=Montipora foliosa TaxID=591990 RepID=UPI0035F20B36
MMSFGDKQTVQTETESVHAATRSGSHEKLQSESVSAFLENATLHGARFLLVGNVYRRLFWTLALLSSVGYCVVQIYETLDAFGERPFSTKITTKTLIKTENVSFPAITICNFNAFNRRRYKSFFRKRINFSDEEVERDLEEFEKVRTSRTPSSFSDEVVAKYPVLKWRALNESRHHLVIFSHIIEEMLLPNSSIREACTIGDKPCSSKNFKSSYNSQFGQCFTFNSGEDESPVINASLAGQLGGLKLNLNIERNSYLIDSSNPYVGLIVLVHDQKSFPCMEQFGFAVKPGVRTLCAIKRKKLINLESPYSTNCTRSRSLQMLTNTSYTYSKPVCLMECINKYVTEKCGCRPIEYKVPDNQSILLCSPRDVVLCIEPKYAEFLASEEKVQCEESCTQPCEHIEYETSLSYSDLQRGVFIKWLNSFQNTTENFALYENFLNMTYAEQKDYIDENIVSLDIYYQDLNYDEIEQIPKFEPWSLIANLGGNFGLFLGISLLSFLELLDFIFRTIWYFICKLKLGRNEMKVRAT